MFTLFRLMLVSKILIGGLFVVLILSGRMYQVLMGVFWPVLFHMQQPIFNLSCFNFPTAVRKHKAIQAPPG